MPSDPIKSFPFLFYLQITSGTETSKERSSQTRKGRKRERKNDSQTQRQDRVVEFALPISLFLDLPLPFDRVWSLQHRADRDLAFVPIAIAAPRRAISPLVEPSCLSLFLLLSIWSDLMIFFFWVLFLVFLYWGMILYICLTAEKMWVINRKYFFFSIFKNTNKHQKIFFKTFFEM